MIMKVIRKVQPKLLGKGGITDGVVFLESKIYDPLTDHPDWTYHSGESCKLYGKGSGVYTHADDNPGDVSNIQFGTLTANEAVLEGYVSYNPQFDTYWTLPFSKFLGVNYIVGARNNNGSIQLVQRFGGAWSTLATEPGNRSGFWRVVITGTRITVYVNGVKAIEADHLMDGQCEFGISGHRQPEEGLLLVSNYRVYPANLIAHNGENVTHKGGVLTMAELLDILNSGDVKSLRLDPPADESTVPNDAIFTRADGELVHRKTDGSDEIIMANPEA